MRMESILRVMVKQRGNRWLPKDHTVQRTKSLRTGMEEGFQNLPSLGADASFVQLLKFKIENMDQGKEGLEPLGGKVWGSEGKERGKGLMVSFGGLKGGGDFDKGSKDLPQLLPWPAHLGQIQREAGSHNRESIHMKVEVQLLQILVEAHGVPPSLPICLLEDLLGVEGKELLLWEVQLKSLHVCFKLFFPGCVFCFCHLPSLGLEEVPWL